MNYHKWNGNMCLNCGLTRKPQFERDEPIFRARYLFAYPGERKWSSEMPECIDVRVIDKDVIIQKVSEYFGVNIFEKKRKRNIVLGRQIAISLLHTFAPMTYQDIAKLFDGNHATAIWSKRKVWNLCKHYPDIRKVVIELETMIE